MTHTRFLCLVVAGILATSVRAHSPEQKPLAFEVASIKPDQDLTAMPKWVLEPGGGVTVTGISLFRLILTAYESTSIQIPGQVVGGPSWVKSDHFDVVAKANGSLDGDEAR